MEGSWTTKPASSMRAPRRKAHPSSEESEAEKDQQDHAEIEAKRVKVAEKKDQIADIFGGSWFIQNWTDPILNVPEIGPQMSVTRFYPMEFVAVDIFTHIGDHEKRVIAAKRKAFKENLVSYGKEKRHVKYGALEWSDPLANLMPQLEG